MDTVILAAGKGERLAGITPPYHKPLLVVNGRPIVQQAVDFGLLIGGRVIVVVAPENAAPISHVLGDRDVRMVVQRHPIGPGLALTLGLEVAQEGKTLVLMGDNISTYADVQRVCAHPYAVGVQYVHPSEATRFTYWSVGQEKWVEKVPPTDADTDSTGMITAWVGPLTVDRDMALDFYRSRRTRTDIGPYIAHLVPEPHSMTSVSTYDIGVPEAMQ